MFAVVRVVRVLLLFSLLGGAALPSAAALPDDPPAEATHLVAVDTPAVNAQGQVTVLVDARYLGGGEDGGAFSGEVAYGINDSLTALLRATLSEKRNFAGGGGLLLNHGGNDFELAVKWSPEGWLDRDGQFAGLLGVSVPDTAAQDDPVLTAQVLYARRLTDGLDVQASLRGVFIEQPLLAFGLGVTYDVFDGGTLLGEYTLAFHGTNTRSTNTGAAIRDDVWGVGFRWAPQPRSPMRWHVAAGLSNAVGLTTGLAMTPALGNSVGAYAQFGMSF